ncbi:MAG: copper chaperone PCu(A)C [Woeseiaceae bacterium]
MKRCLLIPVLLALAACAEKSGPQVSISDVRILAPAIASHASVAYFNIDNNTAETLTIIGVRSPQFGLVEIHETTTDDGVSRMRRIESIDIAGRSTLSFSPGGKHLMLMQPAANVISGTPVTLEVQVGDQLLLVSSELQDRIPPQ